MAHSAPVLHLNVWKGSPCAKVVLGRSSSWMSGTFSGVLLSCCHTENLDRLQLGSASRAAVRGR